MAPFTIFSSSLYAFEPEIISKLLLYHNHSKAVEMAFNWWHNYYHLGTAAVLNPAVSVNNLHFNLNKFYFRIYLAWSMLCHQGHHVHTWKIIHHDPREHWLHGSKLKAIFPEPSRNHLRCSLHTNWCGCLSILPMHQPNHNYPSSQQLPVSWKLQQKEVIFNVISFLISINS